MSNETEYAESVMNAKEITKEYLREFEKEIEEIYAAGGIRAAVHFRAGREDELIKIFKDIGHDDYVFGYWDAHELALLKGVPREVLKKAILAGKSIALSFSEYKVLCSGIAGSLMGVAVGVAWALKQQNKKGNVYLFCGDMSAETGIFHESVKYSLNFDLPIKFVVCDNDVSVMTDTRKTWGTEDPWFKNTKFEEKIIYFKYTNEYPHSGLGKIIKF